MINPNETHIVHPAMQDYLKAGARNGKYALTQDVPGQIRTYFGAVGYVHFHDSGNGTVPIVILGENAKQLVGKLGEAVDSASRMRDDMPTSFTPVDKAILEVIAPAIERTRD